MFYRKRIEALELKIRYLEKCIGMMCDAEVGYEESPLEFKPAVCKSMPIAVPEIKIESASLSTRAVNCLLSEGVKTLNDVCGFTRKELLNIDHLGEATLLEIESELQIHGMQIRKKEAEG
jgi:DNA-directed RNA polymerase alpha subunit